MLQLDILLNEEQKKAVEYLDGPLLVLAGAGTGKTRVITYKIAYLVENCKIPASKIMAVTFTNKAAKEMHNRLKNLIGIKAQPLWAGTFHAISLRILKNEGHLLGLKPFFTIIDEEDRTSIINKILKELNIDKKQYPVKEYANLISKYKNTIDYVYDKDPIVSIYKFLEVYDRYKKYCATNNYIDFDDMLSFTLKLFIKEDPILQYYKNLFQYILVDEYQDTNILQFQFIKYISNGKNICVVGDDDQSIYSWRGADIKNILEFDKYFPETTVIKLTTNYRSGQKILDVANKLILHNKFRRGKNLKTALTQPGKVEVLKFENGETEALFVVNKTKELIANGINPSDIAVLYRTNAQSRIFETYLSNSQIPYRIVGNISFYQRKEIKDILSYLKVFDNPFDSQSLTRALKNPPNGIGDATTNKIIDNSTEKNVDLITSIKDIVNIVSKKQAEALNKFLRLMDMLKSTTDIAQMVHLVVKERDYENYLKQFDEEEYIANKRIYNIYELISAATQFVENNSDASLNDFLSTTTLITSTDELNDNAVNLITVHSAKGLEFNTLFLVGLEEGLFPLYRTYSSEQELEEERRLCYVAITRAKERLYIGWAKTRLTYGKVIENNPSIFIKELTSCTSTTTTIDNNNFRKGNYVEHEKFGKGVIIDINGSNDDAKVKIMFKNFGLKTIIAKFLKMI